MRIGFWNIDHPELHQSKTRRAQKYFDVLAYLSQQRCDVFVLTEANAAIQLVGYEPHFSDESPFYKKDRCYEAPNRYHQVAVYSTLPLSKVDIAEPINGLLCRTEWPDKPLFIYGNVVTIKDQWKPNSNKSYSDRLDEQLELLSRLAAKRFIVCGDFNLRLGWPQRKGAYHRVEQLVHDNGWIWPTRMRTDTVQHVIHSADLTTNIIVDSSVKDRRLSDHPFMLIEIQD